MKSDDATIHDVEEAVWALAQCESAKSERERKRSRGERMKLRSAYRTLKRFGTLIVLIIGVDLAVVNTWQFVEHVAAIQERRAICGSAVGREVDDVDVYQRFHLIAAELRRRHPGDADLWQRFSEASVVRRDQSAPLRSYLCEHDATARTKAR